MGDLIHSGAFSSALLTAFSRPRATFAGVLARHEEILELLTTSDADLAAAQADADAHLATLPEPTKDDYKNKTESAKAYLAAYHAARDASSRESEKARTAVEVLQALSTLEDLTEVTNNQDTVIELVRAVGAGRVVLMTLPQDDIDRQTFWVKFFSGPYRSRIDRNRDAAAAIDA